MGPSAPGDQDESVVAVPVAATVPSCYSFSVAAVVQRSLDSDASVWWLSRRQKRSLVALPQCGGCRSLVVRVAVWRLCLFLRRSLVAAVSVWWLLNNGPWLILLRCGGYHDGRNGPWLLCLSVVAVGPRLLCLRLRQSNIVVGYVIFENTPYRTARTGALPVEICRTQWYQSKAYDMGTLLAVVRSEIGAKLAKLLID